MSAVIMVRSAMLTHPGIKRSNNEDFVNRHEPDNLKDWKESGCLYIVADGVGGAAKGEQASRYAVEKLLYEYYCTPDQEPAERLESATRRAGNDIYREAEEKSSRSSATTVVAAAVQGYTLTVANVGDSRAYLIRNGRITQITTDHNQTGLLVKQGLMTEEEALASSAKSQLTRSVGGELDVKVDIFKETLQPGDLILLCTDGLTRYARQVDLASILASGGGLEELAIKMVDFAKHKGGEDNISVLLVSVEAPVDEKNFIETRLKNKQQDTLPPDWETRSTVAFNIEAVQEALVQKKKRLTGAEAVSSQQISKRSSKPNHAQKSMLPVKGFFTRKRVVFLGTLFAVLIIIMFIFILGQIMNSEKTRMQDVNKTQIVPKQTIGANEQAIKSLAMTQPQIFINAHNTETIKQTAAAQQEITKQSITSIPFTQIPMSIPDTPSNQPEEVQIPSDPSPSQSLPQEQPTQQFGLENLPPNAVCAAEWNGYQADVYDKFNCGKDAEAVRSVKGDYYNINPNSCKYNPTIDTCTKKELIDGVKNWLLVVPCLKPDNPEHKQTCKDKGGRWVNIENP